MAADRQELGKLRWRCRRGMKELDILLTRYVDKCFCGASNPEQEAFRRLLETQDRPPPEFAALIERITADR
jgi:antitoxin CptB